MTNIGEVAAGCTIWRMSTLDELGRRHKRLLRELAELRTALHEAIRAERAMGVTQQELMQRSGYRTIQAIRTITGEAAPSRRRKGDAP